MTANCKNILVFPVSSEVGRELVRSFSNMKEYKLFGAGVDNPGVLQDSSFKILPLLSDPGFEGAVRELILRWEIDYVYPAMDLAINKLSDIINADFSCKLVSSPRDSIKVCFSKDRTYEKLYGLDFVPEVYSFFPDKPVFVKPKVGYGSRGVRKISTSSEFGEVKDFEIAVEYLPGEEYTVECLSDSQGRLKYCFARERLEVKSGVAVKTIVASSSIQQDVQRIATQILSKLTLMGAWFFQVKRAEDGSLKLLEVAPRIAGSMALSRMRGVNLPHLSILVLDGFDVDIMAKDNPVMLNRCLGTSAKLDFEIGNVYIDFDDCLFLNEKHLNPWALAYICHCRNKGRKITIISRHKGDLRAKLLDLNISQLIDEVIHLEAGEKKSDYIEGKFIFFDDSFSERSEVGNKRGKNRVFDVTDFEWVFKGDL